MKKPFHDATVYYILEINECESNPCLNGGMCTDLFLDFVCDCSPGFTGRTCDIGDSSLKNPFHDGTVYYILEINECESNPCLNGGMCTDLFLDFACDCSPGFTGRTCDIGDSSLKNPFHDGTVYYILEINECESNPCLNGGMCTDLFLDFVCDCSPGFTGRTCDIGDSSLKNPFHDGTVYYILEINECESNPCLNGGMCTDLFLDFACDCSPGFTGRTCDIGDSSLKNPFHDGTVYYILEINECESNPCLNGGMCTDLLLDFACDCSPGFTGRTCDIGDSSLKKPFHDATVYYILDINECESNPCVNGGTCFDNIGHFTCDCTPEFGGSRCHLG